ncbi:MAG: 3'(2'),5'-bisphosphate nucleotidase CysQ [Bdellovibrionales bacterium]
MKQDYLPTPQKLLDHKGALCNMVRRIAIEAGAITLKYFDEGGYSGADAKADGSPVTLADQEAEALIQAKLKDITPDIPFIGEECMSDGSADKIKGAEYFWLVDPLDGTKEFIGGGGDYTVNIALIYNGDPVLGVVYAPAKGELYAGHGPDTAIKWMEDSDKEKPIRVRVPPEKGLSVVASKSHGDTEKLDRFLEQFKVEKLVKCGSSLKICIIAAAKADLYPRFGPTCEWDTGAADAVLRAAGGYLTDEQGQPLRYGGSNEKWLNPEFIASSFAWLEGEEAA